MVISGDFDYVQLSLFELFWLFLSTPFVLMMEDTPGSLTCGIQASPTARERTITIPFARDSFDWKKTKYQTFCEGRASHWRYAEAETDIRWRNRVRLTDTEVRLQQEPHWISTVLADLLNIMGFLLTKMLAVFSDRGEITWFHICQFHNLCCVSSRRRMRESFKNK